MKIFLNTKSWKRMRELSTLVENEILNNCNFNGVQAMYFVSDQECNYIEECDEINGTFLLHKINDLLEK